MNSAKILRMRIIAMLGLSLMLSGCGLLNKFKSPSRTTSNVVATQVGTLRADVQDRAAGNNAAIEHAASYLPESQTKLVINTFVQDQFTLLGQPRPETKTNFVLAAEELLSQDANKRASGEALRQKLANENQALKDQLATKDEEFKRQRIQEDADHKAQLDKVRLEAEQAQKKLVSYIFFGAALLGLLLAAVVFTTAASVPMFGPKVAFGCLGFSAVSAGTGVMVLQLMNHPEVVWYGMGGLGLIGAVVLTLMYANHQHHLDAAK